MYDDQQAEYEEWSILENDIQCNSPGINTTTAAGATDCVTSRIFHFNVEIKTTSCDRTYSSLSALVPPPRGFLDLVADKTIVNCNKLHDQMLKVRNTRTGSDAILLSLNESKNSMMSAAVPM